MTYDSFVNFRHKMSLLEIEQKSYEQKTQEGKDIFNIQGV